MEQSPSPREYHGNCHCGLFQFTLHISPLTTVWTCNCSICSRNGYLWIYPVAEGELVINTGEEKALHSYQFAMRGTEHLFCPECGSSVMARRRGSPANRSLRINARMLEGVDLTELEVKKFSGAEIGPKYEPQHAAPHSTPEAPLTSAIASEENELKLYEGNCHCGQYKFSFSSPEMKSVRSCDCSICTRNGYLWLGTTGLDVDKLVVERGEGTLSAYDFGRKVFTHYFCPVCGTSVLGRLNVTTPPQYHINARAIRSIDLKALEIVKLPGGDFPPKYEPPSSYPLLELGPGDEGLKLYHGNCHCASVRYTVKSKPLEEVKVTQCNCSSCSRNGDLWIHPKTSDVAISGIENLAGYAFLSKEALHSFCKQCGGSVLVQVTVEGEDDVPLNVRTIEGIDLEKLDLKYYDGAAAKPEYTVD